MSPRKLDLSSKIMYPKKSPTNNKNELSISPVKDNIYIKM